VVIAAVLLLWLLATSALQPLGELSVAGGSFIQRLLVTNLFLAGFNLLPAFPMDGGRVLRALLGLRLDYVRATQIAATIGQGIALLFGFVGLFSNPFLVFIAFFVWIGASQESSMVQMKAALGGIPVSQAMLSDFRTLSTQESVARAVQLLLGGSQHDFPVLEDGRVAGVLTRANLMNALAQGRQDTPVSEVMQRDFEVVDAGDMLELAFARLQSCGCQTLPVVRNGRLVGLLTADNVGEFLMIQTALGKAPRISQKWAVP